MRAKHKSLVIVDGGGFLFVVCESMMRTLVRQFCQEQNWTVADRPLSGEYQDDTSRIVRNKIGRSQTGRLAVSIRKIRAENRLQRF